MCWYPDLRSNLNKNALSSVESRLLGGGGGAPHIKGLGMLVVLLRPGCKFRILVSLAVFWAKRYIIFSREGLV